MKNILLVVSACIATFVAPAQISLGPVAGVHSAQRHYSAQYAEFTNRQQTDWHAGAIADIGLGKRFSLRPALMHEKYGRDFAAVSLYCTGTYKVPIKNGSYFLGGAGPYLAFDTYKYIGPGMYGNGQTIAQGWLKRIQWGAYTNIGYQFRNGIVIMAYYERILMNMLNDEVDPSPFKKISMYYDNFGCSAGYLFKLSKKKPPVEKK